MGPNRSDERPGDHAVSMMKTWPRSDLAVADQKPEEAEGHHEADQSANNPPHGPRWLGVTVILIRFGVEVIPMGNKVRPLVT
jgi:hypothetical protein